MACEDEATYQVDPAIAAAVRTFHEVDLFLDLDDARIRHLLRLGDEGELTITGDELRSVVEAHLREPHDGITLSAPQSVDAFTSAIDADVSAVLFADPDGRIVHLSGAQYAVAFDDADNAAAYGATVMLRPETHHEWVGCFNEALAAIGDERRFVAFDVADFEEPLYVLATDAQRAALDEAGLVAFNSDEVALPDAVWGDARATELAKVLTYKGVSATAVGEHVVLELDLATAGALLDRLRAEIHHDQRVGVLVAELYTSAIRP